MAADLRWLRGQIEENPLTAEVDLDRLLVGLLHSLVKEQGDLSKNPVLEKTKPSQEGAV